MVGTPHSSYNMRWSYNDECTGPALGGVLTELVGIQGTFVAVGASFGTRHTYGHVSTGMLAMPTSIHMPTQMPVHISIHTCLYTCLHAYPWHSRASCHWSPCTLRKFSCTRVIVVYSHNSLAYGIRYLICPRDVIVHMSSWYDRYMSRCDSHDQPHGPAWVELIGGGARKATAAAVNWRAQTVVGACSLRIFVYACRCL